MLKISLAFVAALIASSAFVTTAKRAAMAVTAVVMSTNHMPAARPACMLDAAQLRRLALGPEPRQLTAQRAAAAKTNVAKVETRALNTANATTPALKKADLDPLRPRRSVASSRLPSVAWSRPPAE